MYCPEGSPYGLSSPCDLYRCKNDCSFTAQEAVKHTHNQCCGELLVCECASCARASHAEVITKEESWDVTKHCLRNRSHYRMVKLDTARTFRGSQPITSMVLVQSRLPADTSFIKASATLCVARNCLTSISPTSSGACIHNIPTRTSRSHPLPRRCAEPVAVEESMCTLGKHDTANRRCAMPMHSQQLFNAATNSASIDDNFCFF